MKENKIRILNSKIVIVITIIFGNGKYYNNPSGLHKTPDQSVSSHQLSVTVEPDSSQDIRYNFISVIKFPNTSA